ncbi:hypothetical protein Asi03nite_68220 [Actinoplanes siamensis]|uniref:Uncharacterized protein n=1 Tax=Actinoplanes siamensis TaxID=1223317 RepID=A0A919NEL1_9ACTN|nr:hypothetical protein Asi03nite_68220 [Actinoplanes siamensis]
MPALPRSRSMLTLMGYALTPLLLAAPAAPAAARPHAAPPHPAATAVTAGAAAPACVNYGRDNYPVDYYWKNALGMRLGSGSVAVTTSAPLWGGKIAPGSTFTRRPRALAGPATRRRGPCRLGTRPHLGTAALPARRHAPHLVR